MSSIGRFTRRAPKSAKSKRAVRKMESKVYENAKSCLFLTGLNSSETVNDALVDLRSLMGPHAKKLAKKNDFHPFTGEQHLEFLCFKNDCSLFAFGSDNKKRPNNLVLGRHYDFQLLDMIEFGIVGADRLDLSRINGLNCCSAGSKPAMIFEGSEFESEPFFERLKNFLVDFFGGVVSTEVNIAGVDRAIFISLRSQNGSDAVVAPSSECRGTIPIAEKGNTVVCFRHYGLVQTKSTTNVLTSASNIKLVDVGPNFDLEVRRVQWAAPADFKRACRLPKAVLATIKHTQDNVSKDALGNLRGHLHVGNQDLQSMGLRKFKAHKEQRRSKTSDAANLTANEKSDLVGKKREKTEATQGTTDAVGHKARKDANGGERMPKKRHRPGQGVSHDTMIGPDVDI